MADASSTSRRVVDGGAPERARRRISSRSPPTEEEERALPLSTRSAARASAWTGRPSSPFPAAVYGDVKARVAAKSGPLECAVCLAAFEDRDELRVLPACCHVFHPDCIDPWLAGAVTCPLCRADLTVAPSPAVPAESCDLTARQEAVREEPDENEEDDERDEACLVAAFTPESVMSFGAATRPHEFHYRRTQSAMDTPDRHTLRLPEHVMKELAAVRRHRRAASTPRAVRGGKLRALPVPCVGDRCREAARWGWDACGDREAAAGG